MQDQWLREGDAFLLVYSITNATTFDEIKMMREKILRTKDAEDIPIVVAGNKCDLEDERQVHFDEGKSFCKSINVPFYETSAKERINDEECFIECWRQYLKYKINDYEQHKDNKRNVQKRKNSRINSPQKSPRKKKKESIQLVDMDGIIINEDEEKDIEDHEFYENKFKKSMSRGDSMEDEEKYGVRKARKRILKRNEDLLMDINIAVIGTHNVGKHSMIHHFIGMKYQYVQITNLCNVYVYVYVYVCFNCIKIKVILEMRTEKRMFIIIP